MPSLKRSGRARSDSRSICICSAGAATCREVLSAFDLFVLSSHDEGMSNAILEAMAMQKPVVATDVGGTGEVVQPGRTGLLVPPKDPAALAQAIDADPRRPGGHGGGDGRARPRDRRRALLGARHGAPDGSTSTRTCCRRAALGQPAGAPLEAAP